MASMASSAELIPLWGRPEWKRRPVTRSVHMAQPAVPAESSHGKLRGSGGGQTYPCMAASLLNLPSIWGL